ncbi:hypothetical protein AVEN_110267-1 [Araneus ventricosus]|uniref:Uncharacterized protein n=1 Tax=Araneus ventricosus TaxID=182803 RepID=A0A4Y2VID6_ARAVE|nr:hypothetical protein AVEN_258371-1 [Araneus ventricosus]GBO23527.1 hypothetical protein AVEN_110267-1 [Araneus ventricosus]
MAPELAPPSPSFRTTPLSSPSSCYQALHPIGWAGMEWVLYTTLEGGRLATTYDLSCPIYAPYIGHLQWNRISKLKPSVPETETLPLGHRGPIPI